MGGRILEFFPPRLKPSAEVFGSRPFSTVNRWLEARGEPVAFEFNLLYRSVMYNLKLGFRPEWRSCTPGHVLKAFMIQQAMTEGASEYDLLGMNDAYKMEWATGVRRHICLCVAGPGAAAALAHWLTFEVKPRLRRWPPAMAAKSWLDACRQRASRARARWSLSR